MRSFCSHRDLPKKNKNKSCMASDLPVKSATVLLLDDNGPLSNTKQQQLNHDMPCEVRRMWMRTRLRDATYDVVMRQSFPETRRHKR